MIYVIKTRKKIIKTFDDFPKAFEYFLTLSNVLGVTLHGEKIKNN